MQKLLPVTIFSLIFVALSHYASVYDPINGTYLRKERFFYAIMSIALILFAGLRISYNDTVTYRGIYETIPSDIELTSEIEWTKIGENPGFVFVLRALRRWNFSTQSFIMIFSIFTVGTNLWFFRKYSCNLFLSVLIFITFAGYIFALAAIKQCAAMAFCLIATDRAIRKKYLSFLIYVIVASMFHPYALMYLVVPFLFFRPWSKYTVIMIAVFAVVGVSMQSMIGTLLNVTDMLGEGYDASSFNGEGVNPIRLLVTAVPTFLSLMTARQIAEAKERDQYMIVNLAMLNAEIMFVALFGTANYFARLANYFIPFQAVSIPWLLKQFNRKDKQTLTITASVCYLLYYIYSNSIHESFDAQYWDITFWEYLQSLF